MAERGTGGGGAAGGSGYEFQAAAVAYVASHIMSQRALNWFGAADIPTSVHSESGGPGDDLRISLDGKRQIEAQVKTGLQSGQVLWASLNRMVRGLREDADLLCVLLVDCRASRTIRTDLRQGLEKMISGSVEDQNQITMRFVTETGVDPVRDRSVIERLQIVTLDLEPRQPSHILALAELARSLSDPFRAQSAFDALSAAALRTIKLKSALNLRSIQSLVTKRGIELTMTGPSLSATRLRYISAKKEEVSTFLIPTFSAQYDTARDWIARTLKDQNASQDDCSSSPEFNAVELISRCGSSVSLIESPAGEGKSLLSRALVRSACEDLSLVIYVRLTRVARRLAAGNGFDEALWKETTDIAPVDQDTWRRLLAERAVLIADGLDECGDQTGEIIESLEGWRRRHPESPVIVTRRIGTAANMGTIQWRRYELVTMDSNTRETFVRMLVTKEVADEDAVTEIVDDVLASAKDCYLDGCAALILAFITRLRLDGLAASDSRATLLRRLVKHVIEHTRTHARREQDLNPELVLYTYRHAGRVSSTKATFSLEMLATGLQEHPGRSGIEIKRDAVRDTLMLLVARGILRCNDGRYEFAHSILADHAASEWIAIEATTDEKRYWIEQSQARLGLHEALVLASESESGPELVRLALAAMDERNAASNIPALAAKMIASVGTEVEDVDNLIGHLSVLLESTIPLLRSEAMRSLIDVGKAVPQRVADKVCPYLSHPDITIAGHAFFVCLRCDPQSCDAETSVRVLRSIAEMGTKIFPSTDRSVGFYFRRQNWTITQEIIAQGAKHLLGIQKTAASADIIVSLRAHCSALTLQELTKLLRANGYDEHADKMLTDLWGPAGSEILRSVFAPRASDLALLLATRRACSGKADPSACNSWDNTPELGKLLGALRFGDATLPDVAAIGSCEHTDSYEALVQTVMRAASIDEDRLATELEWGINELRVAIDANEEVWSGHLYSCLDEVPVLCQWNRCNLDNDQREALAEALVHPSTAVRRIAVDAINGGVLGTDAHELCLRMARKHGQESSHLVLIDSEILGHDPLELFLSLLENQEITEAAVYLMAALPHFEAGEPDPRVPEALVQGLAASGWVATHAAKSLRELAPDRVAPHLAEIESQYKLWKQRDHTQENSVIPQSPRSELVPIIARARRHDFQTLILLAEDHRSDVRDCAVTEIVNSLRNTPELFKDVLIDLKDLEVCSYILREIGRVAPELIHEHPEVCIALCSSNRPNVQIAALDRLTQLPTAPDGARGLIQQAVHSLDPRVSAAGIRTARSLGLRVLMK